LIRHPPSLWRWKSNLRGGPRLKSEWVRDRACPKPSPPNRRPLRRIALGHVTREYPHKLDHVLDGPEDVLGPRALHPDLLRQLRLAQLRPRLVADAPAAAPVSRSARRPPDRGAGRRDAAPGKVAGELAYLDRAYSGGFERPYGWAWLLALHARRSSSGSPGARTSSRSPAAFADRFKSYLPKLTYPIRVGTHFNTAFAMILALEWAEANDPALAGLIRERGRATIMARTATARPGSRAATNSSPRR
jgi:hypothetical protein